MDSCTRESVSSLRYLFDRNIDTASSENILFSHVPSSSAKHTLHTNGTLADQRDFCSSDSLYVHGRVCQQNNSKHIEIFGLIPKRLHLTGADLDANAEHIFSPFSVPLNERKVYGLFSFSFARSTFGSARLMRKCTSTLSLMANGGRGPNKRDVWELRETKEWGSN